MSYLLIDPDGTVDYAVDWTENLGEDTVASSSWSIAPEDPVLNWMTSDEHTAQVFVSGCVRGEIYRLTNSIVTRQGRTLERSFVLRCEHR